MTDPDPTSRDSTSTGRHAQFRFTVDHWAAFWASPHPELAGRVVTPDVVGHWPDDAEPVRGVTRYRQRWAARSAGWSAPPTGRPAGQVTGQVTLYVTARA